jgi:glycosyltransferase involved in cell wall biosynthesis
MSDGETDRPRRSIAFFLKSLNGGGAERVAIRLAVEMLRMEYEPIVILVNSAACPTGDLSPLLPSGIEVVDLRASRTATSFIALARLLRRRRPSAVISFLPQVNLVAVCARLLAQVDSQIIMSVHNPLSIELRNSRIGRLAHRLLAPMADRVVAVSRGVADDMTSCAGYRRDRIDVIPNPVVSGDLTELAAADVDHPFFNSEIPVFVGVGRLVDQKDFATLLRAFHHLRKKRTARLALIGDGPLRKALEHAAVALGIQEDVSFLGFRRNPYPFMKRAAALVLSSQYEGFGIVLVEALALGTPVVSTDCPHGPMEILDNGRFGILVPVGDSEAMACAMEQILHHPTPTARCAECASRFTVARIGRRYLDLIEKARGERSTIQPIRSDLSDDRGFWPQ